jgi:hypothetical protein
VNSTEYEDMRKRKIENNCISIYPDKRKEKETKRLEYHIHYGDTLFYFIQVTKKTKKWKFKILKWYLV